MNNGYPSPLISDGIQMNQAISYSIPGACKASGYSRAFIYISIKNGKLKTYKVGKRRFILHSELEAFIQRNVEESLDDIAAA